MKDLWDRLCARFDSLNRRERMLIFFAAVFGAALLGFQGLIEPHLVRHAMLSKTLAQQRQALAETKTAAAAAQLRAAAPGAQNRAALETLRQRLSQADTEFRAIQESLVPPERMAALVESILRRNRGLKLVSLTTLAASPIGEATATKGAEAGKAPEEAGKAAEASGLFRHGLQVTVRGSYADVLDYVTQLEKLPQKMYWGKIALAVHEYPVCVVQITVYTLSVGSSWLVI